MKINFLQKFIATMFVTFSITSLSNLTQASEGHRGNQTFDSSQYIKRTIQEKVSEPREIQRTPLFDNATFLRLKPGDKLIKAKRWNKFGKGKAAAFEEKDSYFVLSNEKYYWLEWVQEENNKLLLTSGYLSLLFDWDLSLANTTTLYQIDKTRFDEAISLNSFNELKRSLQITFPETLREMDKIQIQAPHFEGESKERRVIFQGLGFDRLNNKVFKYQFEVGNNIYIQHRRNLIIGPRRVERREFEGYEARGINSAPSYQPDPETAAKARAAYERMITFQELVNKFLDKPRINQSQNGFN